MRVFAVVAFLVWLSGSPKAAAATFTVSTTVGSDAGSLPAAISAANANPGSDTIIFDISPGGPQVIEPTSVLPDVTDSLIIDGTTQPGFAGSPIITIDGPGVFGFIGNGLRIRTSSVTIRGLVIIDFGQSGIQIENGSSDVTIVGNFIGVDASGKVARGNAEGIRIMDDADGIIIGAAVPGDRNVISGNRGTGIMTWPVEATGASDRNIIRGNIIGLDSTGTFAVPNVVGIAIKGGVENQIGGAGLNEGNVISGNLQSGLTIQPGSSVHGFIYHAERSLVQGNLIGTDIRGVTAVPNGSFGIGVSGSKTTTIGGGTPGARNVISANGWSGVAVGGMCFITGCHSSEDTVVEGNFIGTDVTGAHDLGNGHRGVLITRAHATSIRANVISGNEFNGIQTIAVSSTEGLIGPSDTVIGANRIGTDAAGSAPIPNGGVGMSLGGAFDTTVGGLADGDGNIIRFNPAHGIVVSSDTQSLQILGNSIDLNGQLGIDLGSDFVTPNDPLDADAGAGGLQNYPVLTSAIAHMSTAVSGTLNSTPSRTFRIEFFGAPAADPSGFGEGRTFLGFLNVSTGPDGHSTIAANLAAIPTGSVVTATATDLTTRNTSEFSNAVVAFAPATLSVSDVTIVEGNSGTASAIFTASLSRALTEDVTVQYATADQTASAPSDYVAASGTVLIPAGNVSATISVEVRGDSANEPDETFLLRVTVPSGPATGDAQGQAVIANDDPAAAAVPIPTVTEWGLLLMALLMALAGTDARRW